jgi:hypothetical protein
MKPLPNQSTESTESLLQEHIFPLFSLPDGDVMWQGDSVLDIERLVYYFCINNQNYILVNELHHGVSDSTLMNLLIGNAVAPHQKVASILPKEGHCTYVNVSRGNNVAPQLRGDFSAFRIVNR